MKFRIISPDAAGTIDHVLRDQMLRFMDESWQGIPFVPISYFPNYRFNADQLLGLEDRRWVLCDMTEYGWDWDQKSENVLGRGVTRNYSHIASDEWAKLDEYVAKNPPLIHFKRELRAVDKNPRLMPVEHLCYSLPSPIQSKAAFDARQIEVNHTWGWSHPRRAILHADIFRAMTTDGVGVISELNHCYGYFKALQTPGQRTWASIYKPWYARSPAEEIAALNERSKISVSLPGAGNKCFRSCEAPVGSIMALAEDRLAWAFPWEHGVNCIRLNSDFTDLDAATQRVDLYEIYVNGQATVDRYRSRRYVDEYLIPNIEARL